MNIPFIGDLHDDVETMKKLDKLLEEYNCPFFVQVGDLGACWPGSKGLREYFRDRAHRAKSLQVNIPSMFSCGGNHDVIWAAKRPLIIAPDLIMNPRGYVMSWQCQNHVLTQSHDKVMTEDINIGYVGGAESHDCFHRSPGLSWWSHEELFKWETERAIEEFNRARPSIIVSHDCPTEVRPRLTPSKNLNGTDTDNTSQLLSQVLRCLDYEPDFWFYGHHHFFREDTLDGLKTKFICCGANVIQEAGLLLDTDTGTYVALRPWGQTKSGT